MTGHISMIDPWKIVTGIRYAYPGLILFYFVVASTVSVCSLQTLSLRIKSQQVRRDIILWLMFGVFGQYIIHALLLLVRSFLQTNWVAPTDEVVYLISSALVWGLQYVALLDSKFPVWYPYIGNWAAAIMIETALLIGPTVLYKPLDAYDFISISISTLRVCSFIALLCVYFVARKRGEALASNDEERQPLLSSESNPGTLNSEDSDQIPNDYGAMDDSSDDEAKKKTDEEEASEDFWFKRQRESEEKILKRLKAEGNWWTYSKGFLVFFPYIWPIHNKTLQFRAMLTGLCLLAENFMNVLVPRQLGLVTDALVAGNGSKVWIAVAVYSVLTFANSSACIGWLQFWLWQPIEQYSYDALTAAAHAHVMSLSSEFHESRTSSDIHQTISQGKGIREIVNVVCFSIGPTFMDLFLVSAYLYYLFGPYMALDIAAIAFVYLYTTTKLVSLASNRRRTYHTYYRKELASSVSSVNNWRIASYFNQIPYEHRQHHSNIKAQLNSQWSYLTLYNIIRVAQNLVMTVGLLGACFLAVYQVLHKTRSPGDFVILLSYWAQLRGPLGTISNLYKTLSESLMDAERMLEIFKIQPRIADKDDAKPLILVKGEIVFKDVSFAYDDRKGTLNGINLKIDGGSTVAIVGETGSGKSTTLKLLQRFYDVKSGSIEIDGQDIRDITVESLRENIAVVPQDPTLFSETIMTNLRYAKMTASKQEVYEACKTAKIHEKIMSMPDKYNYKVGNTAVKLSGGEQQRIAIARAILKHSSIILLDEATSSVDTETEQQIQEALDKLCQGRTTVIVAHRLSTIMRADRIVVMKDGSIIEHGSHEDLLRFRGKYFDLWASQIQLLNPDHISDNKPNNTLDVKTARARSNSPQVENSDAELARFRLRGHNKNEEGLESSGSRSKSPRKDKAGIVNDLDPDRNQAELLKLAELSKLTEGSSHEGDGDNKKPRHPKLKADAPEFYPLHLRRDTEGTVDSTPSESKKEAKDRLKLEKDHKKQEEKARKSQMSLAKRAAKNAGKQSGQLSDIEEPRDDVLQSSSLLQSSSSATTESSQGSATSGTDNNTDRMKMRRPRFSSRRHMSKSEPAGQDGSNDSEDQGASWSGDTQPSLGFGNTQHRRVSAPSDPISSQQESRSSSLGVRSRRARHWRIKNRPGSSSGSVFTSAGASSVDDASMDEAVLPNPPNTSPAGGLQTASVKFAPDS